MTPSGAEEESGAMPLELNTIEESESVDPFEEHGANRKAGRRKKRQEFKRSTASSSFVTVPSPLSSEPKNIALLVLTPPFNTERNRALIREAIPTKLRSVCECHIPPLRLARNDIVGTHFDEYARYATHEVDMNRAFTAAEFRAAFPRENLSQLLSERRIMNSMQALTTFGITPTQLHDHWNVAKHNNTVKKLKRACYCAKLLIKEKTHVFVLNGFYMALREDYVRTNSRGVHIYQVEWHEHDSSWKQFYHLATGTDIHSEQIDEEGGACRSSIGSLQRMIYEENERAELSADDGESTATSSTEGCAVIGATSVRAENNALYASSSALEGLAQRCNWMAPRKIGDDEFGRVLLGRGIPESTVMAWLLDIVVTVPPSSAAAGPSYNSSSVGPQKKRVFDVVRGMGAPECMDTLVEIYDYDLFGLDGTTGNGCNCIVS